ncbi:MAG TPA: heparinase II/III family protein [Lysobacter sp.]
MRGFTISVDGTSSDEARWDGENAILVYDWCHYAISDTDRTTLLNRWNGYVSTLNAKPWGGTTMAANNYFWGYLRNSLLWGIASYHDNGETQRQTAQGFIDNALQLRYRSNSTPPMANGSKFSTWYNTFGVGGVPLEGNQYGPYMTDYPVIAFTAATDYGYNAWDAVPFWRDAVYYLHYAATPTATRSRDGAQPRHELFPFNDDEMFASGGSAEGAYNDFLAAMILRDPARTLARQAQSWMQARSQQPSWRMRAELASVTVSSAAPTLPLDYYAEGAKFLYGRRDAGTQSTAFMLQLGGANAYGDPDELEPDGGVGHSHQDLGNFQLWRKGRWLSRESTGYGIETDGIRGWNNGAKVDPASSVAHNTALFEGRGQIHTRRGWAQVKRLQSTADFAFAAVDMTESYRAPAHETWLAEDDWPFAEAAIREFIYLRGLDALVVLDRLTSGSDSLDPVYNGGYSGPKMTGAQVRKSFVLHATGSGGDGRTNPFVLGTAQATATVGDQRLDLHTLLPANPVYRVIDEAGPIGQFRLEYDVSGSQTSYLLNVVSARDASDAMINAVIADLGDRWELNLSHPQKGAVTLVLLKGVTSSGGTVKVGSGAAVPLRADRQGIMINDQGVSWADGSAAVQSAAARLRRR